MCNSNCNPEFGIISLIPTIPPPTHTHTYFIHQCTINTKGRITHITTIVSAVAVFLLSVCVKRRRVFLNTILSSTFMLDYILQEKISRIFCSSSASLLFCSVTFMRCKLMEAMKQPHLPALSILLLLYHFHTQRENPFL